MKPRTHGRWRIKLTLRAVIPLLASISLIVRSCLVVVKRVYMLAFRDVIHIFRYAKINYEKKSFHFLFKFSNFGYFVTPIMKEITRNKMYCHSVRR